MNSILFFAVVAAATITTFFHAAVNATSDDNDDYVPEVCDIQLQTGEWIEITRYYDTYTNAEGEEVPSHDCEQLQQDWANTTYTEYLDWQNNINEARRETGQMFSDDRSTLDVLKDIEEKLEELNR